MARVSRKRKIKKTLWQNTGTNMQTFKLWEIDCWDGFKKAGMKKGKGGKMVNNCVPEEDTNEVNGATPAEIDHKRRKKRYRDEEAVPKGYHKMPDGTIMKDDEMDENAMKRMAKKKAYLAKTMKKYGDATKAGMNPADVNQRRNKPTLKKR